MENKTTNTESLLISNITDYIPAEDQYIYLKPSEIVPKVIEEMGELSPDEIDIVKRIASNKEFQYVDEFEIGCFSGYKYEFVYTKASILKMNLQKIFKRIEEIDPDDRIHITFVRNDSDDDNGCSLIFNIPTSSDLIHKRAIKTIVRNIQDRRKYKEEAERKQIEEEKRLKIAQEREEEELSRLIAWLQAGIITQGEFRERSDSIYNKDQPK